MKIRFILLFLSSNLFSLAYADKITASCTTESGVTNCLAGESSQQSLLNLDCQTNGAKSSCNGKYVDEESSISDFSCSIDSANMQIKCGGGSSQGKFTLTCGPADLEIGKIGCLATHANGQSLKVICDMTNIVDGIPDCSGFDEKGKQHRISCQAVDGKTSCSFE